VFYVRDRVTREKTAVYAVDGRDFLVWTHGTFQWRGMQCYEALEGKTDELKSNNTIATRR